MSLQKAVIEVDANDRGPNLPARIVVQFNPAEYTLAKGAQIAEIAIPGIDSPILQFVRGQNEKLTLELFFDTTQSGMGEQAVRDVRELTDPVYQLVKIQSKTHAPPRVRFIWGNGLSFRAIVESVQQKFTVFNPAGIPLRAALAVSFREYKTLEEQLKELNLQSADHTKRRKVRQGDTLAQIAFEEYRDASKWRRIAEEPANATALADPRRLVPGTEIVIPALDVFGNPDRRT
ncbi:MAG TPA: peptidoglycan-binding protein [Blastocatellia bacterium]|nr:peptidoglycan-binding protein [Blastocatellia bacterium]